MNGFVTHALALQFLWFQLKLKLYVAGLSVTASIFIELKFMDFDFVAKSMFNINSFQKIVVESFPE